MNIILEKGKELDIDESNLPKDLEHYCGEIEIQIT